MKRTREITIIHYRRRRVKRTQVAAAESCPMCESGSALIPLTTATAMTGINRLVFEGWIASKQVHTTRSNQGQVLVCLKSLTAVTGDR